MMNILYVWFPASWGPSVVEAIQTRNVTCLAKKPIVRDPHIFDRKEAAKGSRAREVTCRIQKWNIKAEGFHPILVANARVDWLAMDDDDITKKFPILLEGILQDVFSQRAASAWQGAQPQKLTVSNAPPRDQFCGRMARLTGEAPPERRTIHFIFTDPILVAMECVPVSSSNDLKQDVRSCVRSVKIQKLYETFVVSHQ